MKKAPALRALLLSLLSLAVCLSMFVGTTFAWFTDSVTSANNIIKSGTLDVELYYQNDGVTTWTKLDSTTNIFKTDTLWEPGHTEVIKLKVTNEGTLAFKYQLGINIISEVGSKTADGTDFNLSDHIRYGIANGAKDYANRQSAINDVAAEAKTLKEGYTKADSLLAPVNGAESADELTLVVYMPESAGNMANYGDGQAVPTINLGLNLVATQLASESDSFNSDYDSTATFPAVDTADKSGEAETLSADDVSVTVPAQAENGNYKLIVSNKKVTTDEQGNSTLALDIDLLKDGVKVSSNGTDYTVTIDVGTALTISAVTHKGEAVTDYTYDPSTGILSFVTDSFSPFAVEYVARPVAIVTDANEYENVTLDWKAFGGIPAADSNYKLETAYYFTAKDTSDTVNDSKYKDWYTDYFVSLDRDLTAPNQIFLGGNYGSFGWVGFTNPEPISANTKVPLLGSATGTGQGWPYKDIVNLVGTFICGVADIDDCLTGATFTVELRITNPDDTNEYYTVAEVNYTFQ